MSLKAYGVIDGIVPIGGGWRYEQPYKGELHRIPTAGDAGSSHRLVEMVKRFRINQHIDMGDVEGDVAEYIKKESPINNRFPKRAEKRAAEAGRIKHRPLIERIRDNLLVHGSKTPRLLLIDEVERRTEICLKCPQNIKWMTGCIPCCDEITSRGQNLRQQAVAPSDALRACRLHDYYLPAITFLDRDELGNAHIDAPAYCWMKTELPSNFDRIEDTDTVRLMKQTGGTWDGYVLWIECPGCESNHMIPVEGLPSPHGPDAPIWRWDFNKQDPTVTPSILAKSGKDFSEVCHFVLTKGILNFQNDCTHKLKGQRVKLQPIPVNDR